jgi:hypothetical protein
MSHNDDLLAFQLPGGRLLKDATAADLQAAIKFYIDDMMKNPWWSHLVPPLLWWLRDPFERKRKKLFAKGRWIKSIERELQGRPNARVSEVLTEDNLRQLQSKVVTAFGAF